jgi:hypothetical protein
MIPCAGCFSLEELKATGFAAFFRMEDGPLFLAGTAVFLEGLFGIPPT